MAVSSFFKGNYRVSEHNGYACYNVGSYFPGVNIFIYKPVL